MGTQEYAVASLPTEALGKVQRLETELKEKRGKGVVVLAYERRYHVADLPEDDVSRLKALEEDLSKGTGRNVVMVAYEED